MENKIDLSNYVNSYVKYFQVAQLNLSKYLEEEKQLFERLYRRKRKVFKKE